MIVVVECLVVLNSLNTQPLRIYQAGLSGWESKLDLPRGRTNILAGLQRNSFIFFLVLLKGFLHYLN
jgi:hypothetical protein